MNCRRCLMDSRVVVLSLCLLFLATASAAQFPYVGTIRLFCDSFYTCAETDDTVPGILRVYVVHDTEGVTGYWHLGAQFMVSGGGGFTGTWVGDASPYPNALLTGTSPTGVQVAYGMCAPPGHLLTITYMTWGTSTPDSYLEMLPHPDEPSKLILVISCWGFEINYCDGGRLTINPSGVPTESTTWGRIKGMYE